MLALMGLGAIGTPIADKLYSYYGDKFALVADEEHKKKLLKNTIYINGKEFAPQIITDRIDKLDSISLIIVCIKNYDLKDSVSCISDIISGETVILPLQNGIESYEFFKEKFTHNTVLQGYVQGPNTIINHGEYYYKNAGKLHMGNPTKETEKIAKDIYLKLYAAGVDVCYENQICRMVWKKWMLNVAGNSVTALTGADYSMFKDCCELQEICRECMEEFLIVARRECIELDVSDVDDVIDYYKTYCGNKKTSMLVDIMEKRRTENEYIAGSLLRKAKKYSLKLPITETLYKLIKIKEKTYLA